MALVVLSSNYSKRSLSLQFFILLLGFHLKHKFSWVSMVPLLLSIALWCHQPFILLYMTSLSKFPIPLLPQFFSSTLFPIHFSSISLWKREGLPGILTKHGLHSCNNTSPCVKAGWGDPVGGKGSPEHAKEVETTPTPSVRTSIRRQTYPTIAYRPTA